MSFSLDLQQSSFISWTEESRRFTNQRMGGGECSEVIFFISFFSDWFRVKEALPLS